MVSLFIFLGYQSIAQKYPFRNFSSNEGLNANQVLSIFQNDDRQLWIGTSEGINFYDGINFTSPAFLSKINKKVVYDITKIQDKIFIGTTSGLCILENDSLYFVKDVQGRDLSYVYKTFQDSRGTIWIGTEGGLKKYENGVIVNSRINILLGSESVYNICETKPGTLWFCSKTSGLFKYNGKKTEQFLNFSYPNSFIGDVIAKDDSTIWASSRDGLYSITPSETIKLKTKTDLDTSTAYYDILKATNGDIWITSNNGVHVYRDGEFQMLKEENGLIDNTILKVLEDQEKTLWFISTNKGVSQLINEKMILWDGNGNKSKKAVAITPKNKNEYFISNDAGLSIYNKKEKSYESIFPLPDIEYFGGVYDTITKILFMGTNDGILTFSNGDFFQFLQSKELRKIYDIEIDENGQFWLATSGGVGFIKSNEILPIKPEVNLKNYVLNINKGKNGELYFAGDDGLLLIDSDGSPHNYSRQNNFNVGRIRQTAYDIEGNIWVASDEGLFKKQGDQFLKITSVSSEEIIQSLVFDNQNRLWAGLRNGFLQINFNQNDTSTRFYSKPDGFLGNECNFASIYCDDGKDVWIGTDKGLVIFRPKFDFDHKTQNVPKLNIKVNGISDLKEYAELSKDQQIAKLNLPTANNQVEFSFKIVNLLAAKEIKFQYQLEGVDEEWKETPNDYKVIYSELSHGSYKFKLRVLDHPNLFPQEEIQTVEIFIQRPFYLQWWFILLILIIVGTWLYSYFLIKRNVSLLNRQKAIILNQKGLVEEKNKEIVDSITYAKRIQDAILPNNSVLNNCFHEYFVLYKPRDIVSGDFYWVERVDDWVVFTAADCTGHGVPGAMVSLMCSNLLRKVILEEKELDPGKVLDLVTTQLLERLQGKDEKVADGMDLTLCFWNTKTNQLKFSGAHNPLYLIREGELQVTKTNKQPIGYFEDKVDFTTHEIQLQKHDQIILFSDGYKDQFGGAKNKKFGAKRFNKMLVEVSNLPLEEQEEAILLAFNDWKGSEEQVDDICILSIKI